jgi:hypothetical protein
MISRYKGTVLAVLAAVTATMAFAPTASAYTYCRERTTGSAASYGLFGWGTAQARSAAVSNYAVFSSARGVRWNCRTGVISKTGCTVSAIPCRNG